MKKRKSKRYTEEFKLEAVRLCQESGKPKTQIAKDLGIYVSMLYSWINRYDEAKSLGLTPAERVAEKEELAQLKRENKRLKQENDILKKASAYLAQGHL